MPNCGDTSGFPPPPQNKILDRTPPPTVATLANGLRTVLKFQRVLSTRYFDVAGFPLTLGLLVLLIPMIAWYLGIGLLQALLMDLAIVAFYLVYTFFFNIAYDRVFPLPRPGAHDRAASRALPA